MNQKQTSVHLLFAFILLVGLIAITRFTNLKPHWGSLEVGTTPTITVSGLAEKEQNNQIADFTVGMESIEASKEEALNKVNDAMNQLIDKVKEFGIEEKDIQTQTASVYQETDYTNTYEVADTMYPQRGDAKKGDWIANNSINIKLREVDKAEALLAILNGSDANYVYGPNFSIENENLAGDELLTEAVTNAREKAEKIAAANNQKVGKIISLTESGTSQIYPTYKLSAIASAEVETADASLEPGSSTTSKSVTVTFELN